MAKVYEMKRPAYDAVARTLHWLTVLLVAMQSTGCGFFEMVEYVCQPHPGWVSERQSEMG